MTRADSFFLEPELAGDEPAIDTLLDEAFGRDRLSKTSYRLREQGGPVEGLSFVLRHEGGLAGTIRFWPIMIGKTPALLLGPLAVHPIHHGHGGGQMLMRAGLARAREAGHELVLLVGDEPYYAKAGFQAVPTGRVEMPGPFDAARLLYQELVPGAFEGVSGLMQPDEPGSLRP